MAKKPKSLASYNDVKLLLEKAAELGSLEITLNHPAEAGVLIARTNKYRMIYREREEAAGREHASPFDHLVVRHKRDEAGQKTSVVLIETRIALMVIKGPDGKELDFASLKAAEEVLSPEERTRLAQEDLDFLEEFNKTSKPVGALGLHTDD